MVYGQPIYPSLPLPGTSINAPRSVISTKVCTKVELSVSCRDLMDKDIMSKSDPMVVLFVNEFGTSHYVEKARTETILNNLNPDFVTKFVVDYCFEERQKLKFEVYDIDSPSPDLSKHDFLGMIECTLGEIVSVGSLQRKLQGERVTRGCIMISAEEVSGCNEVITMRFTGSGLDRKHVFGRSRPYLAFYKANEDATFSIVHRTEVKPFTLNPVWMEFSIALGILCGGDPLRTILVKCMDWSKHGKELLIGEFTTNAATLALGPGPSTTWEIINPTLQQERTRKKRRYRHSGVISLMHYASYTPHIFLDYISAGTQLNCTIAIDFTASNGELHDPNSLHYAAPYQLSQYALAIRAVGDIIQDYDSDKLFPVLGFGAKLPPFFDQVSHLFYVNGNLLNPHVYGIDGVMNAYERCRTNVKFFGPTNFAPIINHVARFAATKRDGSQYFILLMLTDGIILDLPETKKAIVEASCLPLSIIIVGIGNADFEAMEELDGDKVRVSYKDRRAERDIVQFVSFRNFIRGTTPADTQISQAYLAKTVLEEIPEQLMSYMNVNRIQPGSWPKTVREQHKNGNPAATVQCDQ